ncbi:hypothetical protein GXW82_13655 [Streptacidiphilus sp. 4-A2]|nr:hypothetical protein [Streptacidiphilus sp. 4-A2]
MAEIVEDAQGLRPMSVRLLRMAARQKDVGQLVESVRLPIAIAEHAIQGD